MTRQNSDPGQNPEPDAGTNREEGAQKGLPKGRSKQEHKNPPRSKQVKAIDSASATGQQAERKASVPRVRSDADRARLIAQIGARRAGERYLSRGHRWNPVNRREEMPLDERELGRESVTDEDKAANADSVASSMMMPLFPLQNVVLFPGMVLPLHVFEPRYREMINRCIAEESQFGVVLVEEDAEVGDTAVPHRIGTAAKINKVTKKEDGRMDIVALGTQRFEILELDDSRAYLQAKVKPLPIVNGATRVAVEQMQALRPRIIEYVELLSRAMRQKLPIDRLPEDPTTLALLVAIGMQMPPRDKQRLLERPGVPEMLALEAHLLSRETLFLAHMLDTQNDVQHMNMGPSGYIFPN